MRPWMMAVALLFCSGIPPASAARSGVSTWEEYKVSCRQEINTLGVRIDVLEARSRGTGSTSRELIRAEVKALRARRAEIEVILVQLEASAGTPRRDLLSRYDRGVHGLKQAYRDAKRKLA